MKLRVWNVGHGEALRLDFDGQRSLVRDFGTRSKRGDTRHSVREIVAGETSDPLFKGDFCDAMLSHAHRDHYSGFSHLLKSLEDDAGLPKFSRGFIHRLKFETEQSVGFQLTRLGVYLYIGSPARSAARKSVKNWLVAAPTMYGVSEVLYAEQHGNTISFGSHQVEVMWPPFDDSEYLSQIVKEVRQEADAIAATLLIAGFNVAAVAGTIAALAQLEAAYYQSRGSENSINQSDTNVEGGFGQIEFNLSEIAIFSFPLLDTQILRALKVFNQTIDNVGLVISLPNNSLFLSDLDKSALKAMCELHGAFAETVPTREYRLVKSSHHGTRYSK